MSNQINKLMWLAEQAPAAQPDPAMGSAMTQPGGPGDPMGADNGQNIPQNNPPTDMANSDMEDLSDDPQYPDMPQQEPNDDFEIWKIKFVKESIKGDPNILIKQLLSVRDRDLEPIQFKFVEDNIDINDLRRNSNILNASNEIRKLIKKDFDRTNPGTTVVRYITQILEQQPLINEVYIKLLGLGGSKMDQHRKFVGALLGAIQVGSGGMQEDLIFEEQDYSIRMSTRFNARWGDVNIGRWYMKEDDPDRYLKHVELERMEGGSPEEKDVLRRRVVMESIAAAYMERAFIINVVGMDGTVYHIGWDLGNSLKSAYLDGKLVVRTGDNDNREAFIDEDGSILVVPHMAIYYVREGSSIDEKGKPEIEEIEFINYRDGVLYLTAQLDLIKEAATTLEGIYYKETLWQGNPSDIKKLMRCVPSSSEMLLRQS